jgi:hypothetical protein
VGESREGTDVASAYEQTAPVAVGLVGDVGAGAGVFQDYDMVVSLSQRLINDQLAKLVAAGALPSALYLSQDVDENNDFVYTRAGSEAELDKDLPYVAASFTPQIDIPATGSTLNLVLAFRSGTASFWTGAGPGARQTIADMSGWRYACTVSLDLATIDAGALGQEPEFIRDQLQAFTSAMFDVSRLFLDLESTDTLRFDAQASSAPGADDRAFQWFEQFMQFYLADLVRDHNPFVLGYPVTAAPSTPAQEGVPDLLQPSGTTYTLYHEPSDPGLSSLNYVLVPRGGHQSIAGAPPALETNWLAQAGADAMAVYSRGVLTEPMLIAPVFTSMSQGVYQQISGSIGVGPGNDYGAARQEQDGALMFTISDVEGGDDRYVNRMRVAFGADGGGLDYAGVIWVYKHVSKDDFFCTAEASSEAEVQWAGHVALTISGGGVSVAPSFQITGSNHNSNTNSCAEAFSWIGRILGGILDTFTFWTDGGFLSNTFADAFSVSAPGIGDIDVALGAVGSAAQSAIVLPAAGALTPAQVAIDHDGNVDIVMNYGG